MADNGTSDVITIKKYANRRLYNTASSKYVTLDDLAGMVKRGTEFVVVDAKSGVDITRSVLTQIIFEEESKGHNLLPINFLRQLISFYGDSLQSVVPNYLEYSMNAFTQNEEAMRTYMKEAMGGMFPFNQWEEIGKQNVAMFERAMKMFTPFAPDNAERAEPAEAGGNDNGDDEMSALKAQLKALQNQVDELSRAKGASKRGRDD